MQFKCMSDKTVTGRTVVSSLMSTYMVHDAHRYAKQAWDWPVSGWETESSCWERSRGSAGLGLTRVDLSGSDEGVQ